MEMFAKSSTGRELGSRWDMEKYEIRLVRKNGGPVVYASTYISDYAAVRGARILAAAEDSIEIWRGMHCIYRDQFRPVSTH
jgi:hypothetical protein